MKLVPILVLLGTTMLVACGGGDDTSTTTGPIASTLTFPLQSGYKAFVAAGFSKAFTVSGGCTGSGNRTSAPANTAATFEGKAGFSAVGTLTMNLVGCTPASVAQSYTGYYDTNYNPTGVNSPGVNYGVYLTPMNIPTSVTVGSTGLLGNMSLYTSSTKATSNGRIDQSYVVEADTASTAIVNLISKSYNASGTLTTTEQARYRMSSTGSLTPTTIDIQYANGSTLHVVLRF